VFKPSVLLLALMLTSPALWSAFVTGSMSVTTALIRFLIAVPVAAGMLVLLRMVTESYHRPAGRSQPRTGDARRDATDSRTETGERAR
jgi:hypothetical protein